jgi:hypothetical protein
LLTIYFREVLMKAKDLMIPLQEYLTPDHTLKEAANLLRIAGRGEEKRRLELKLCPFSIRKVN